MAVAGYNIYLGGVKQNTDLVTDLSYALSGLTAETAYSVTVSAVDGAGNESAQSAAFNFNTTAAPVTNQLEDDFTGSAFNTSKWNLVNPNTQYVSITQNNALIIQTFTGSTTNVFNNKLESIDSFGDAELTYDMSFTGSLSPLFYHGFFVDANNFAAFTRASGAGLVGLYVMLNGSPNVQNLSNSFNDFTKLRITAVGNTFTFYGFNGSWVQLGVPDTKAIGASRKVSFYSASSSNSGVITIDNLIVL